MLTLWPKFMEREPFSERTGTIESRVWLAFFSDLFTFGTQREEAVPFDAAMFSGQNGMSWGVSSGLVPYLRWRIGIGRRLRYRGAVVGANCGGGEVELRVALPSLPAPNMLRFGATDTLGLLRAVDAGSAVPGLAIARAGQTYVALVKADGTDWTATGGDNTTVEFDVDAEVQGT
jgi:hypothetical protein